MKIIGLNSEKILQIQTKSTNRNNRIDKKSIAYFVGFLLVNLFCISLILIEANLTGIISNLNLISFILLTLALVFLSVLFDKFVFLLILPFVLSFLPILNMALMNFYGSTGVRLVIALKDFSIVIYLASWLFIYIILKGRKLHLHSIDWVAIGFVAVYILFFIISPASIFARASSLREGLIFVCCFAIGRFVFTSWAQLNRYFKWILFCGALVALFGFVEYFFSSLVWLNLDPVQFNTLKANLIEKPNLSSRFNLPFNWSTQISGVLIRRMVGPIADPTAFSRFLTLPTLSLLFLSLTTFWKKWGYLSLFLGGIVLSLGRGGFLIVAFGVFVLMSSRNKMLGGVIIVFVFALMLSPIIAPAFYVHVDNIYHAISQLRTNPIGLGLGTSGQTAINLGLIDNTESGESYFAALAFQTGLLGVLFYAFFSILLSLKFLNMARFFKRMSHVPQYVNVPFWTRRLPLLSMSLMLGIFLTSLMANSAVSGISAGLSLIVIGATYSICYAQMQQIKTNYGRV
jgi:hypothetical protein